MAEADAGRQFYPRDQAKAALKLTPDDEGGGTLAGYMTVQTGGINEQCPGPDGIGIYLGQPVGGQFTGTIAGRSLSGSAELSGSSGERAVKLSVEASESGG